MTISSDKGGEASRPGRRASPRLGKSTASSVGGRSRAPGASRPNPPDTPPVWVLPSPRRGVSRRATRSIVIARARPLNALRVFSQRVMAINLDDRPDRLSVAICTRSDGRTTRKPARSRSSRLPDPRGCRDRQGRRAAFAGVFGGIRVDREGEFGCHARARIPSRLGRATHADHGGSSRWPSTASPTPRPRPRALAPAPTPGPGRTWPHPSGPPSRERVRGGSGRPSPRTSSWMIGALGVAMAEFWVAPILNCLRATTYNKDYTLWYRVGRQVLGGMPVYPKDHRPFPFMYPPPCATMLAMIANRGELPFIADLAGDQLPGVGRRDPVGGLAGDGPVAPAAPAGVPRPDGRHVGVCPRHLPLGAAEPAALGPDARGLRLPPRRVGRRSRGGWSRWRRRSRRSRSWPSATSSTAASGGRRRRPWLSCAALMFLLPIPFRGRRRRWTT